MSEAPARPDGRQAWIRLATSLALMTVGSAGMYVVAVVLPVVQAEFGIGRSEASLPYTLMLVGFGIGGILMGRLADRHGVTRPLLIGAAGLAAGFTWAALSGSILSFALAHGLAIGLFGCSATFAPLVADTALWFVRRRGIAVAICASGNYLAGTIWPPVVQHFVETVGWREAYLGLAALSALTLPLLALRMRARPPVDGGGAAARASVTADAAPGAVAGANVGVGVGVGAVRPFGLAPGHAQALLCVAGVACCVAMAMPQVHIVAYCSDLGYGAARGAEMLSLMLGFGIVSRLVSGAICDRIGGLRTLLLGSALQGIALLLFLPFDGLVPLYLISALFGLFQGGIVPSYAIIVREHFPVAGVGGRTATVLTATLLGMALGGWMSGWIHDLSGSYQAAFINGIGWNLLNLSIAFWLLRAAGRMPRGGGTPAPA